MVLIILYSISLILTSSLNVSFLSLPFLVWSPIHFRNPHFREIFVIYFLDNIHDSLLYTLISVSIGFVTFIFTFFVASLSTKCIFDYIVFSSRSFHFPSMYLSVLAIPQLSFIPSIIYPFSLIMCTVFLLDIIIDLILKRLNQITLVNLYFLLLLMVY